MSREGNILSSPSPVPRFIAAAFYIVPEGILNVTLYRWISLILHLYVLYAWGNFYLVHSVTRTRRMPLSAVNGHGRYNNTVSPPEISRRCQCLCYKDNNFKS